MWSLDKWHNQSRCLSVYFLTAKEHIPLALSHKVDNLSDLVTSSTKSQFRKKSSRQEVIIPAHSSKIYEAASLICSIQGEYYVTTDYNENNQILHWLA